MGQITSSIGLVSGINTADIIDQLIELETQPRLRVEAQNATLQEQQSAFAGISAQLLSLKLNANRLALDATHTATTSGSSNEAIATISSSAGTATGEYKLTVKQLSASQQLITRGFTDDTTTPVAPSGTTLTFEKGLSRLDSTTFLEDLNGGEGIQRGKIRINDRAGDSAIIDLSDVITVDDVLERINENVDIRVSATLGADGIELTDQTGQTTNLFEVYDLGDGETADSLGLVASVASSTITGEQINTVGKSSVLATLNDGKGVGVASGSADLQITTAGGGNYSINLDGAATLGDVIKLIEEGTGDEVTGAVTDDGYGLKLTDTTGGGAGFTVASVGASTAAADLGIEGADDDANGDIDGERLIAAINSKLLRYVNGGGGTDTILQSTLDTTTPISEFFNGGGLNTSGDGDIDLTVRARNGSTYDFDLDGAATAQDLIDLIDADSGGTLSLSIEGNAFRLTDNTAIPLVNLRVTEPNGTAGTELGLIVDAATSTVLGNDVDPTPTPQAATGPGTLRITNSAGGVTDVDISTAQSVRDLLDAINDAGAGVKATLNRAGHGLQIKDQAEGAGDLIIADLTGDGGEALGLLGTFEDGFADSGNLQYQYVAGSTLTASLGVDPGIFTIRDSSGASAQVDLTQGDETTIAAVLNEINSRGLQLTARLNDTGDGILIEDTGPGFVELQIEDLEGSAAADLGLAGTAAAPGENINGSYERTLTITGTDTLEDLATKIEDAGLGISAGVINDGSLGNPFRLNLSADKTGTVGAFIFDDGGAGFNADTFIEARDAAVLLGGDDPASATFVRSTDNTLEGVIPGSTITLNATSDEPVSLTVSDDPERLVEEVSNFVTGFNEIVTRIDELDSFDTETEERGLLLGDPVLQQVRSSLFNAVIGFNTDLTGRYQSLSQIGITVGSGGTSIEIDEGKLREAIDTDPDAVRELFATEEFELDPDTNEPTETVIAEGIAVEIDRLLERLTDAEFGVLQSTIDRLDTQILQNNNRIDTINDSIEAKRERLQRQFNNMETALAQIQDQGSALSQLQVLAASA